MRNLVIGAIIAVISALSYALLTAFIKLYALNIPMPVLVFFQSFISLTLSAALLYRTEGKKIFAVYQYSSVKRFHFLRAIFSLGLSYFLFISIGFIPYFDAVLLFNLFPLWVIVFSFIIFKIKTKVSVIPMVILGFIGVFLALGLDRNILSIYALFALFSGMSAALSVIMQKRALKEDSSIKSLYYYFLIATIISGIIALAYLKSVNALTHLNMTEIMGLIITLIIAGLLLFISQATLIFATQFTLPSVVSGLYYSNIVFSFLLGIFIFNNQLTLQIVTGIVLIIFSGIGIIYFQNKKRNVKKELASHYQIQGA